MADMPRHPDATGPDRDRRSWYDPEELLEVVNVKAGAVCADLGCGSGTFTFLLAKRVGNEGRVYAVDTSLAALDLLKVKKPGANIVTLRAELTETRLTAASCDLVLLAFTLSSSVDSGGVLAEAARLLKPDGKLALIEWRPVPPPPGPPIDRRIRSDRMQRLLETHGFVGTQHLREGAVYYTLLAQKGKPVVVARPQPSRPTPKPRRR